MKTATREAKLFRQILGELHDADVMQRELMVINELREELGEALVDARHDAAVTVPDSQCPDILESVPGNSIVSMRFIDHRRENSQPGHTSNN